MIVWAIEDNRLEELIIAAQYGLELRERFGPAGVKSVSDMFYEMKENQKVMDLAVETAQDISKKHIEAVNSFLRVSQERDELRAEVAELKRKLEVEEQVTENLARELIPDESAE